ncbi:hypothetical protein [Deinococcus altitudinis]|uniref:hypothetical protein n=1 Tax=Deinococcus altitudinis TaxID=468914 RepID=UPI003891CA7E
MYAWIDALAPDDKTVALLLVRRGCQFVWRSEYAGEPVNSPMETDTCWFEIWHSGELLSFVGPFRWPLPEGIVRTTGTFMIRQAEASTNLRSRH